MRMVEASGVAVLAVDPTSRFTGGAILGDKTRMPQLSSDPLAYVRPSATRGSLGGVTRSTSDAMTILEAAGFPQVIIETVGVGQSETAVSDLVDCVLLVLPPSGGDDLQAMKRGIMEVADIVVVNKADGDTESAAHQSVQHHRSTLGLLPQRFSAWRPQVMPVSAHTGRNLDELLGMLTSFRQTVSASGELAEARRRQHGLAAQLSMQQIVLERLQYDVAVRAFLGLCLPPGGQGIKGGGNSGSLAHCRLSPRCIAQLAAECFLREHHAANQAY
mmetsp:Transcript_5565/g.15529  ORF Transcript_5565/g.15529 Transcript_5565/m.15529 type:complete len:274 (+) Transcript_5565:988-1809(+)